MKPNRTNFHPSITLTGQLHLSPHPDVFNHQETPCILPLNPYYPKDTVKCNVVVRRDRKLCQRQDLAYYIIDPRVLKLGRQLRDSCLESIDRCLLK